MTYLLVLFGLVVYLGVVLFIARFLGVGSDAEKRLTAEEQ